MNYSKFEVSCTNPAKSAAIESCRFEAADWKELDAAEEFCSDHGLELSEVRIDPIGEDGEIVTEWIHLPGEVDDSGIIVKNVDTTIAGL